jgi:hypothetical protein
MNELFKDFPTASTHARKFAASSNQVIGVFREEDNWLVQPLDEDPSYWMNLIECKQSVLDFYSFEDLHQYGTANDESFG